jgi:hypothetical protein
LNAELSVDLLAHAIHVRACLSHRFRIALARHGPADSLGKFGSQLRRNRDWQVVHSAIVARNSIMSMDLSNSPQDRFND